jgi:hypothetical protein
MAIRYSNFRFLAGLAPFALAACGPVINDVGNVSELQTGTATAQGLFRDSNVSGLQYQSGAITGVTASGGSGATAGQFTYEVGSGVTFSVGGVSLGTTAGDVFVTPTNLIANSTTNQIEVLNITRFLMMLDNDGNPDNGITISGDVRDIAPQWTQVNFSTTNLDADLFSIMSDVASVDDRAPTLPDAATAKAHLDATLLCSYSGAFGGTYSDTNGQLGQFGFLVDGRTGAVSGHFYRTGSANIVNIGTLTPLRFDNQNINGVSVTGRSPVGDEFTFQFTTVNQIDGNWQNTATNTQGTFTGLRIDESQAPVYRFIGTFTGDDNGVMAFGLLRDSVGALNNVAGNIYNATTAQLSSLNGRLIGQEGSNVETVDAVSADVKNFTGNVDFSTMTVSGTWTQALTQNTTAQGTFSGTGCRLN